MLSSNETNMRNIINGMRALCPISDESIAELEQVVTLCHFPKRYQLIKENTILKAQ